MNLNDVTMVFSLRNRPLKMVKACLDSIKGQTVNCKVIVVDYGSDKKYNLSSYGKCIVAENTEMWCKPRAMNIGFRQVDTKWLISSDIDCIFKENFIEEVMLELTTNNRAMVLCGRYDLDEKGQKTELRVTTLGSCIGLPTEWIHKVHGYDEFYKGWGKEDEDLVARAVKYGFGEVWITDRTEILHQWHPDIYDIEQIRKNHEYFKLEKPVKRNLKKWGI